MTVIILEKVPPSLKGELSRWMVEVSPGVYVGQVSALVRDLLWEKCILYARRGRCHQLYRTNTEQGFAIRMHGDTSRAVVDFDGLQLVALRDARWSEWMQAQPAQGSMTARETSEG